MLFPLKSDLPITVKHTASVKRRSWRQGCQPPTLETALVKLEGDVTHGVWFQFVFALSILFQEEKEPFVQQPTPH